MLKYSLEVIQHAIELSEQGVSVADIARTCDTDYHTVVQWLYFASLKGKENLARMGTYTT